MKKGVFTLLLTLFTISAWAQEESQTEYNFLRLPMSAHAAALGGDNISIIEDDASLMMGNPALLSTVSDKTVSLNYMNYMAGSNTLSASFNRIVKERTAVAVSGQYINYGTMKETDESGVESGEFSAKDIAIAGYLSYLLTEKLAGGVAAKFIASYIGDYNSLAVGVDLGLNYYDPETEWSLSLVAKNLGGQVKAYDDVFEKMPIDVQLGATKRLTGTPFRFSLTLVDLNHPSYKLKKHLVGGVDLVFSDQIWIGAGYNFRRAEEMTITSSGEESSHGAGLSCGAGLNLERFKINLAYGKYHVSSSSLVINAAFTL